MNKRKKRIFFVQIENFHGEVLGPQLELLEREYDLFLFASPLINSNNFVSTYQVRTYNAVDFTLFRRENFFHKIISLIVYIVNLILLRRLSKKVRADFIIFNTIPSVFKIKLVGMLFKGMNKVLIVHNAEEYIKNPSAFLHFNKVLFLSEEVHDYCLRHIDDKYKQYMDYFIPIFFDKYLERESEKESFFGSDKQIVLGIIGKTDATKRDYSGLLRTLKKYKKKERKFLILISGEVLQSFVSEIKECGLDSFVTYKQGYQSFSSLFSDIASSDVLLFLINKEVKFFDKYNRVKISGTTNMAKAFCKPVAYSKDFNVGKYLSEVGIPYNTLEEFLDRIQSGEITKAYINLVMDKKKCKEYKKFQAEHYREMIRTLLSF